MITKAQMYYRENKNQIIQKNKEYYKANREKILERNNKYYLKNKERLISKQKIYYSQKSVKLHHKQVMKEYQLKNSEKIRTMKHNYYIRNKDKTLAYNRLRYSNVKHTDSFKSMMKSYIKNNLEKVKFWKAQWVINNKNEPTFKQSRALSYKKWYSKNRERRIEYSRKWHDENPRSGYINEELVLPMLSVRIRDKNTCQWFKCGKTHREASIHVHHIFPRSEYPELQLIEKYMICYCREHHIKFHEARGDINSAILLKHQIPVKRVNHN